MQDRWLSGNSSVNSKPEICVFCHVCSEKGFKIVWQDDKYIAFEDHKPASRYHFLIIPHAHIDSISENCPVREMHGLAKQLLRDRGVPPEMRRVGFHIAPFNSVEHLHLHVQGTPYLSLRKAAGYLIDSGYGPYTKGFSWFIEIEQAIGILERGGTVKLIPC
ncbi:HIT-like domain containing protein [Amanita muscaria]